MHATTRIRFHGVAAYEIVTRNGQRILCDPFLDENPGAATRSTGFDRVDLVVVSHAAFDHLGEENAFAVLARANALAAQGRDIISLGIGQPDFRTADHIAEAAIKAIRDGHHGYTAATGIPELRAAVSADLHKRYGVEVSPDSVMIMPGGKPTMYMSIMMFGEPGVEIMYPDPGFPIYRSMIEFTGATPVPARYGQRFDDDAACRSALVGRAASIESLLAKEEEHADDMAKLLTRIGH